MTSQPARSETAAASANPPQGRAAATRKEVSKTAKAKPSKSAAPKVRIIAIANQKGGVGKSTTAVSVGAALAEAGHKVLVIDLDPQGNASTGMGIKHESRDVTIYEVLANEAPIEDAIVQTPVENLFAIPSTIDLAGAEIELVSLFSREMRLQKALEPLKDGRFEFVLFDCPPSLGLLTVNALAAADELIVPIQCEYYALEGLGQLLRNVSLVQQNVNTRLRLTGIVMTMFDSRTKLSEQVVDEVKRYFGDQVYDTIIPRTVRLSEAPGYGEPITVYDPKSKAAQMYRALAKEVAEKLPPKNPVPLPQPQDIPDVIPAAPPPRPTQSAEEGSKAKVEKIPKATAAPAPAVESDPEPEPQIEPERPRVLEAVKELPTEEVDQPEAIEEAVVPPTSEPAPEPDIFREESGAEADVSDVEEEAFEEPSVPRVVSAPLEELTADPEPQFEDLRDVESPLASGASEENQPQKKKWRLFRKGGDA